jgi:hypothetical protein
VTYRPGVVATLLLAIASTSHAQDLRRLLPGRPYFPTVHAGAGEPVTAARAVFSTADPTRFNRMIEGEAAFGASVPAVILSGRSLDDAIVLGVEGSVVARFNLETKARDLISSDWMFGVPLVVRRGREWVRIRYFHDSAHLGDEYMQRFGVPRVPYSRDALDALGSLHVAAPIVVYAGGRWAFRVDPPGDRRFLARAGLEVGNERSAAAFRPFGAVDVQLDQDANWRPRLTAAVGEVFAAPSGRDLRLVAQFVTGPTAIGELNPLTATYFSVGVEFGL